MEAKTFPEFSSRYPLLLKTFMRRPLNLYPNEIGVVNRNPDTGQYQRFTWRQWYERTCRLANALQSTLDVKPGRAFEPGDRVATLAQNNHRHLELYYAAPCMGAVLHPIVPRLSFDHIVHSIEHAQDTVLFVDDIILPLVEMIYERIRPVVKKFVYMSDGGAMPQTKIEPLYDYEELIKGQSPEFDWPYLDEDTYATLMYTTATTGLPKGAMFTHRQLYLQAMHAMAAASWAADPARPHPGDAAVLMLLTPLCHANGWGMPHIYVFGACRTVLPGRFTPDGFCDLVQTEKVSMTTLVPTMLAMLIEFEDLKKYDLSSLQMVGVGGAALPLGLKRRAEELIPGFSATSGYGMTETGPLAVAAFTKRYMRDWPKEERDKVMVKTGLPFSGLEIDVFDEIGKPVPHDNETIGEIVMRGPWIMEKYYRDPEKTAQVWREDGWFHSGDVAKVDEEGYLTIADRITDVIRSGAEMIPTVLLENLTASADGVLEATYVGVPDPKWGERPMAIVKLAPGCASSEDDIYEFLQAEGVNTGRLTRWMLPDFIAIIDEIPKTSVGKYDKATIKKGIEQFLSKAKRMRED